MMEADASASALALSGSANAPLPPPSPLPFRTGDRWIGTYTCRQGPTDMALVFEDIGHLRADDGEDTSVDVSAIFEFHFDGKGRPGFAPAEGRARMHGTYSPKSRRLKLIGSEWIEQPPSYMLIDLVGVLSPSSTPAAWNGTFTGNVEGGACTTFSARKAP
jgi:hypothetical protein